jgi:hypothetical protein
MTTTQRAYTLRIHGLTDAQRDLLTHTHAAINRCAAATLDSLLTVRAAASPAWPTPTPPAEADAAEHQQTWWQVVAGWWFPAESRYACLPQETVTPDEALDRAGRYAAAVGIDAAVFRDAVAVVLQGGRRSDAVLVDRRAAWEDLQRQLPQVTPLQAWNEWPGIFLPLAEAGVPAEDDDAPMIQVAGQWWSNRLGLGKKSDRAAIAAGYAAVADWLQGWIARHADVETVVAGTLCADAIAHLGDLEAVHARIARPKVSRISQLDRWCGLSPDTPVSVGEWQRCLNSLREQEAACRAKGADAGPTPLSQWIAARLATALGIPTHTVATDDQRATSNSAPFLVGIDHGARRYRLHCRALVGSLALRRSAQRDAERLQRVPTALRQLVQQCWQHVSQEGDQLRERAVTGWAAIVDAWQRLPATATVTDRHEALQALWEEGEVRRGHVAFLWRLAEDDARALWADGPQMLLEVVTGLVAQRDALRYLHPRVSHPHPLLAPVWVDYGASRMALDAAATQAATARAKLQAKLDRLDAQRTKAKKNAAFLADLDTQSQQLRDDLRWLSDARSLRMGAIDPAQRALIDVPATWANQRLMADLGVGQDAAAATLPAGRCDRLGRALAGLADHTPARLTREDTAWNGRLRIADRRLLERAHQRIVAAGGDPWHPHTWDAAVRARIARQWHLDHSATFTVGRAWADFAAAHGLHEQQWPHGDRNGQGKAAKHRRGTQALHLYDRLPGVRVLAVSTSIRNGASLAVVTSIAGATLAEACRRAGMTPPTAQDHRITVPVPAREGGGHYVRVGPDTDPDGNPHPAPWARIDRREHLRLPGADQVRRATPSEITALQDWYSWAGIPLTLRPTTTAVARVHALHLIGLQRTLRQRNLLAQISWLLRQNDPASWLQATERWVTALRGGVAPAQVPAHQLWLQYMADTIPEPVRGRRGPAHEAYQTALRAAALRLEAPTRREAIATGLAQAVQDLDASPTHGIRRWLRVTRDAIARRSGPSATLARHHGGLSWARLERHQALLALHQGWADRVDPLQGPQEPERDRRRVAYHLRQRIERLSRARERWIAQAIVQHAIPPRTPAGQPCPMGVPRHTTADDPRWAPCPVLLYRSLDIMPSQTRPRNANRIRARMRASTLEQTLQEAADMAGLQVRPRASWWTNIHAPLERTRLVAADALGVRHLSREPYRSRLATIHARLAEGADLTAADEHLATVAQLLRRHEDAEHQTWVLDPQGTVGLYLRPDGRLAAVDLDQHAATTLALDALRDPDWSDGWMSLPIEHGTDGAPRIGSAAAGGPWTTVPPMRGPALTRTHGRIWRMDDGTWALTAHAHAEDRERIRAQIVRQLADG